MAIIDFFDRGWRLNPEGAAYIQGGRAYSFNEVGRLSCRIARALQAAGFGCGSKGAVWAGNDTTAWTCALGLWRANMAWIPVGARNAADENCHVLDNFDCDVLFYQKEFEATIAALRPQLPKIKRYVCIDGEAEGAISLPTWVGTRCCVGVGG